MSLRFLWRQKAAFHVVMGGGLCALWGWGLIYWTPTFLQRAYDLDVGQAGAVTGNIHLIGGSLATVGTAWLLSRPSMADPRRVVWLLAAGIGFATIPSVIAYWTHSLWVCKLMFCIFIPAIYFYIGPCFGLLNNLAPCHMRNMFIAISPAGRQYLQSDRGALGGRRVERLVRRRSRIGCGVAARRIAGAWRPTGFWAAYHLYLASKTIVADQKRAIGYTKSWAP